MKNRIRVNGVLYEAVGNGDWLDNLPKYLGDWEWDGDDFAIFQKGDMSYLEVTVTYGDDGDDVLTADVYLDLDYPQQISRTVSARVPEDKVGDAVKVVLDTIDPVIDRYGYDIENLIDERSEESDGEILDDDDLDDALDRIRPKLDSALQKAARKVGNLREAAGDRLVFDKSMSKDVLSDVTVDDVYDWLNARGAKPLTKDFLKSHGIVPVEDWPIKDKRQFYYYEGDWGFVTVYSKKFGRYLFGFLKGKVPQDIDVSSIGFKLDDIVKNLRGFVKMDKPLKQWMMRHAR